MALAWYVKINEFSLVVFCGISYELFYLYIYKFRFTHFIYAELTAEEKEAGLTNLENLLNRLKIYIYVFILQ